jgi:hypothetical protein
MQRHGLQLQGDGPLMHVIGLLLGIGLGIVGLLAGFRR